MKYLPIFTYGTLRAGFQNHHYIDLRHDKINDGIVMGASMYKFPKDDFPMVVMDNSNNSIYGEVVYIKQGEYLETIEELDELEGYRKSDSDKFVRIEVTVTEITTGEEVPAWMYVASQPMVALCENEAEPLGANDWEVYLSASLDAFDESIDATLTREDEEESNWDSWGYSDYPKTSSYSYSSVQPATKGSTKSKSTFYMEEGKDTDSYIWYVAYGSNLNTERFLKYMNVGRYGNDKFTSEDIESVQVQVPHGIYFAKSGRWGSGGIAFIDTDTHEDFTCAMRAYKLTVQQFWSVVCQENGSRSIKLDWSKMPDQRNYKAPQAGLYSRVVNLGTIDGVYAFTVTNPDSYVDQLSRERTPVPHQYLEMGMLNPPSREYLNTINEGAEQTSGLPAATLIPFKNLPKKPKKVKSKGSKKAPHPVKKIALVG